MWYLCGTCDVSEVLWVFCECTVSVLWVYCECFVSVLWGFYEYCKRFVWYLSGFREWLLFTCLWNFWHVLHATNIIGLGALQAITDDSWRHNSHPAHHCFLMGHVTGCPLEWTKPLDHYPIITPKLEILELSDLQVIAPDLSSRHLLDVLSADDSFVHTAVYMLFALTFELYFVN